MCGSVRRVRRPSVVFCALALGLAGCGGSRDSRMAPVSGTVTYRGQPLVAATVVFAPRSGDRGAEAVTDKDGRYVLSTLADGDGTWIGEHRVAVISRGPPQEPPPGHPRNAIPDLGRMMPGEPLIPERYLDVARSPLSAKVEPGDNVIDFALVD